MRVWRLVAPAYLDTALTGGGAARYGGRWNGVGRRVVYTADSLALATLELTVHLTGAHMTFAAIELDVPDHLVAPFDEHDLTAGWRDDESETATHGNAWLAGDHAPALAVPSALVDARSGERNLLLDPAHHEITLVTEVQRFEIVLDERLG